MNRSNYDYSLAIAALSLTLTGCNATAAPQHDAEWYAENPEVAQSVIDRCNTLAPADQTIDCAYAFQGQAQREVYGAHPRATTIERSVRT